MSKTPLDILSDAQILALVGNQAEGEEIGKLTLAVKSGNGQTGSPSVLPTGSRLRPIPIAVLGSLPTLSFPIYARADSQSEFSLLLPKGVRVTENLRRRIEKRFGGTVYIQTKDYADFSEKAEDSMAELMADKTKEAKEKAPVFFSYATDRLNEAFRRISEESEDDISLVIPVAEHALELVQQDWRASFSILRLAQSNPETYAHSLNVCFFGMSYVHNYLPHYSEKELKEIALGFLSHDIGALVVAETTLKKKTELTTLERRVIEQIPLHGAKVLKEAGCDYPLTVDIVLNHHERPDGQGYPRGLAKSKIPVLARLCAICEAFDTMMTPQPYRKEYLTAFEALRTMLQERQGQFDTRILTNFIHMMGGNPLI